MQLRHAPAALQNPSQIAQNGVFPARNDGFVYIAPMAKISPITVVTNIHGMKARAISLAITTVTTKAIIKTITIR